jgi:hypothetical protein
MMNRIIKVSLFAALATMACTKDGGRPAPNSVPVPQQAPAQAPAVPTPDKAKDTSKVPEPGKEDPEEPNESEEKKPEVVKNTRAIQYDNEGSPQSELLIGRSFFVNNFDPMNLPEERKLITVSDSSGGVKKIKGIEVTHLSNESYLGCTRPECVSKISSEEEYSHHAQNCWIPSLADELADFKFSFDKKGKLRFVGNINGVRYGAKNIEYSYDGRRTLYIAPFTAAGVVNEKEMWAIEISAVPDHGDSEAGTNIKAVARKILKQKDAYKIKSTINVDLGKIENGRFVTTGNARRYVGGLLAYLQPIKAKKVKSSDVQE